MRKLGRQEVKDLPHELQQRDAGGGEGAQSALAVADVEGDAAAIDAIVGAIVDAILDAIAVQ